jgi:hypothetical protein
MPYLLGAFRGGFVKSKNREVIKKMKDIKRYIKKYISSLLLKAPKRIISIFTKAVLKAPKRVSGIYGVWTMIIQKAYLKAPKSFRAARPKPPPLTDTEGRPTPQPEFTFPLYGKKVFKSSN